MFFSNIARSVAFTLCVLLMSCTDTDLGTDTDTPKNTDIGVYSACQDSNEAAVLSDSECGLISAPLDYGDDNNESISLFIRKFPARQSRRGTVLLLAGGPGESGASFYADIDFFRDTFANFDLIVPDHRGTGYSTKLCEPEETQTSEGGLGLVGDEWGSCLGKLYATIDRTHAFNLDNAAQDVATVIGTLQSHDEVYLYGVSYGTSLALAVAERTNVDLSGVILDSLTPLPSDDQQDLGHRSQVTDRIGQTILSRCAADPSCLLGKNAVQTYVDLLNRIDSGETVIGLEAVPNGDLRQFMGLLLDVPAARNQVPAIIAAMASNDEAADYIIKNAVQTYETFLSPILAFEQASASIPLTSLMSGSEFNTRKDLTPELVAAEKSELGFTSPLPGYLASNGFPLYEPSINVNVRTDLPPLLVLQGTLDSKTTYEAALRRVEVLSAVTEVTMITLIDTPHATYLTSKGCLKKPLRDFIKGISVAHKADCAPIEARLQWE